MTDEETVDEILDGRLKIRQSRRGYRFNLDSLILAHFVSLKSRTVNLDLGCGNGIIALILASRFGQSRWHGLEVQPALADQAARNVAENGLASRVIIDAGDAREIKKIYAPHSFDAVVFNPPYRKLASGKMNPLEEKAVARHEVKGSLAQFLTAARYVIKPKGRVFTIYPALRLVELVVSFRKNHIEPKRMKLVFSDQRSAAAFVLVEGRNDSREELKMEPPLYIYGEDQRYTAAMRQMFTDLASFPKGAGG